MVLISAGAASLVSKGALIVAGLGVLGLGAATLVPVADLTADSWFDQPVDGSVLVAGVYDIRVHYRFSVGSTGLKVVNTTEFGEIQLTDDQVGYSADAPGTTSYLAEFSVELTEGEWELTPVESHPGVYPSIHVIVLPDDAGTVPDEAAPDPRPTEEPSDDPTEEPSEEPADPDPSEDPVDPDPEPSAPSPSSAPSAPAGPAFSGSVSRNPGADQWTSNFVGSNIGPSNATTNVQVNVRNLDTNGTSGWVSVACVPAGGGQCVAQRFIAPKPGSTNSAVPPYEITYRLQVTAGGTTWYGQGGTWYTDRYFSVG